MNENIRDKRRSILWTLVLLVMVPVLLAIAIGAQQFALGEIRDIRKLERIPLSTVEASLPGPVRMAGNARPDAAGDLVRSEWTDTDCLWYRAIKEREERDSEGNTSWNTVSDVTKGVPWRLEDSSGSVSVDPDGRVDYELDRKYRRVEGKYRYTEYRIDPGDAIRLVGILDVADGAPKVTFPAEGEYVPIITDRTVSAYRATTALLSTIAIILSVFMIASAVTCLMLGFRLLNTLAFAVVVGGLQALMLLIGGLLMMSQDLRAAQASMVEQSSAAERIVRADLSTLGVTWDGRWTDRALFDKVRSERSPGPRIAAMRDTLGARAERTREVRERFPQNVVAWATGLDPTPRILAPGETPSGGRSVIVAATPAWWGPTLIALVAMIAAWIGMRVGFGKVRLKRLIENVPTLPAADVEIGVNELKGVAEACEDIAPLSGPLTKQPCHWYRYVVQEWRGSGKNRRLHTISDNTCHQLLLCRDDSGAIPVKLDGARVICGRDAVRKEGKRVYNEHSIRPGDPLYVLGSAEIDPTTGDSLRMEKDPQGLPYLVSNLPEERLKVKEITVGFWMLAAGIASVAATMLGLLLFTGRIAAIDQFAVAMAAIGSVALLVVLIMYNDLVFLRQRVEWARSNIDVALRKRADLLPALDEIARGYRAYESEVQPMLARLRAAWGSKETSGEGAARSVAESGAGTGDLLALRERYPELKADTTTDRLMKGIVRLENEVAARREGYNAAVERYRARIHGFPELFLARVFSFRDQRLLEWDTSVRNLETLDFEAEARPDEEHRLEETAAEDANVDPQEADEKET